MSKLSDITQFALVAGEEVLHLSVTGASDLASVVNHLTSSQPQPDFLFKNVFTAADKTPVHIPISGGSFFYMWQPAVIPLICTVHSLEDGIIVPHLGPEDKDHNALMQLDWKPPFPLFYLLLPKWDGALWKLDQLYFFGLHKDQVWRPPLPNCFEDGRACHNTSGGPGFATATELLEWTIDHMRNSVWNAHLRQPATARWVKFKPKGKGLDQLPCPTEFLDNPANGECRVIGNKLISTIAELWLMPNKTPA